MSAKYIIALLRGRAAEGGRGSLTHYLCKLRRQTPIFRNLFPLRE